MVSARVLGLRDVGEELARVADVGCGLVANLEGDPLSPFEHDVRMGERRVGDATHEDGTVVHPYDLATLGDAKVIDAGLNQSDSPIRLEVRAEAVPLLLKLVDSDQGTLLSKRSVRML